MPASPGIVAHVIVGSRFEPYLPAVLDSIAGVCSHAVINDNSGYKSGANDAAFEEAQLSIDGRMTVIRTGFTGFADARNACIDATPPQHRDGWALFVDADEVHGDELPSMASLLPKMPVAVDAVDGYSRHFVGSFSWWFSIERRLCFFRLRSGRRWEGVIHERLVPLGRRVVLPCVWAHYGHVVTPRMEWEKSRHYSSLGQSGFAPTDEELASVNAARAWDRFRPDAMRFRGTHPPAARRVVAELSSRWATTFADVDKLFSIRNPIDRLRRGMRRANYARLIAFRGIAAGARWGWSA